MRPLLASECFNLQLIRLVGVLILCSFLRRFENIIDGLINVGISVLFLLNEVELQLLPLQLCLEECYLIFVLVLQLSHLLLLMKVIHLRW